MAKLRTITTNPTRHKTADGVPRAPRSDQSADCRVYQHDHRRENPRFGNHQ